MAGFCGPGSVILRGFCDNRHEMLGAAHAPVARNQRTRLTLAQRLFDRVGIFGHDERIVSRVHDHDRDRKFARFLQGMDSRKFGSAEVIS